MDRLCEGKDKFLGIPYRKRKLDDGKSFPDIINQFLDKYKGNIIFGGSSLIHDLYFPEEKWERDYDLWMNSSTYISLRSHIRKIGLKKIKESAYENGEGDGDGESESSEGEGENEAFALEKYGRFMIRGLTEYLFEGDEKNEKFIIQLIDVGRNNLRKMIKSIDLSFNTVIYDGTHIYYFETDEEEIRSRSGYFIPTSIRLCECTSCKFKHNLTEKERDRIKKYERRGFSIDFFCPLCQKNDRYANINHCTNCWKKYLGVSKITEEMIPQIETMIDTLLEGEKEKDEREKEKEKEKEKEGCKERHQNYESIILSALLIILSARKVDLFESLFQKYKSRINPYSRFFEESLEIILELGSISGFKVLFEFAAPRIPFMHNKRISKLFITACSLNYLDISKYLSSKSNRFELDIFEDKIVEYRVLSVFEYFMKYKDLLVFGSSIKKENSEEICAICHDAQCNMLLSCGHKYCDCCIISYFAIEFRKNVDKPQINCPLCRKNIEISNEY